MTDVVMNVFEAVDVIMLIKGGQYADLELSVGEALLKRGPVSLLLRFVKKLTTRQEYPGIYTCSTEDGLDTIFETIKNSRVHRLVVIDDRATLKGVLSLSDILEYILLEGEQDATEA